MSETRFKFHKNPQAVGALYAWRRELAERDRGGRARLRRCVSPLDAVFEPAFHHLLQRVEGAHGQALGKGERASLAAVAALVARLPGDAVSTEPVVAKSKRLSLPTLLGTGAEGSRDQPRLHPLRFRKILDARNLDELFPVLRRALAVLGTDVDLVSLADGVLLWGDDTRRLWAYDYYAAFSPKGASR